MNAIKKVIGWIISICSVVIGFILGRKILDNSGATDRVETGISNAKRTTDSMGESISGLEQSISDIGESVSGLEDKLSAIESTQCDIKSTINGLERTKDEFDKSTERFGNILSQIEKQRIDD